MSSSQQDLHLSSFQNSTLFKRRLGDASYKRPTMPLESGACRRCHDGFEENEQIVNSTGEVWHQRCFVCAQCMQPFPNDVFYEFEGRKYCENDFRVLYAPFCAKCHDFIVGRVIKSLNKNWHPACFCCELCQKQLADVGFLRHCGRALCRDCHAQEKTLSSGKYICYKCKGTIDETDGHIKYKNEVFHPYHFSCKCCGTELDERAREIKGELHCQRCHDKTGIEICGACRRPIEDRVVTACGKNWHVEHFLCTVCEKPFLGSRHFERNGLAYCEQHFYQLFGNVCFKCSHVITGHVFEALFKTWCDRCFSCSFCSKKLDHKTKFHELDMKPVCTKCFDKLPKDMQTRLNEYQRMLTIKKTKK